MSRSRSAAAVVVARSLMSLTLGAHLDRICPVWAESSAEALALAPEGPLHLQLRVALGHRLALVLALAALAHAQLDLHPAVLEVHRQRDEGVALPGDLVAQPLDLLGVEEQLAGAVRVVGADAVGVAVRRDVHAVQPDLPVDHPGIRVGQLHVAEAQALDLAAAQHDAALERLDDRVVVPCSAVGGDGGGHWSTDAIGDRFPDVTARAGW